MSILEVFFLLMMSHAICDFALQNDYIAQAKNPNTALGKGVWPIVLLSHGLIHSAGVYIVTMSAGLAFIQLVSHCIIDYLKCDNKMTYVEDQAYHALVMILIAILYVVF